MARYKNKKQHTCTLRCKSKGDGLILRELTVFQHSCLGAERGLGDGWFGKRRCGEGGVEAGVGQAQTHVLSKRKTGSKKVRPSEPHCACAHLQIATWACTQPKCTVVPYPRECISRPQWTPGAAEDGTLHSRLSLCVLSSLEQSLIYTPGSAKAEQCLVIN